MNMYTYKMLTTTKTAKSIGQGPQGTSRGAAKWFLMGTLKLFCNFDVQAEDVLREVGLEIYIELLSFGSLGIFTIRAAVACYSNCQNTATENQYKFPAMVKISFRHCLHKVVKKRTTSEGA